MIINQKYCPKCGKELIKRLVPNEEDFFTHSIIFAFPINRAGDKYDRITGERLYRSEYSCPTKAPNAFLNLFGIESNDSHYTTLGEVDLTK